ncbi:MAG: hypothetical protein ACKVYV_18475 [Limisphaerales bacterium]
MPPKLVPAKGMRFRWELALVTVAGGLLVLDFWLRSKSMVDTTDGIFLVNLPSRLLLLVAGMAGLWRGCFARVRDRRPLIWAVVLAILTGFGSSLASKSQMARRDRWFSAVGMKSYEKLVSDVTKFGGHPDKGTHFFEMEGMPTVVRSVIGWEGSKPVVFFGWSQTVPRFGYLYDPDDDGITPDPNLVSLKRVAPCWFEVLVV